MDDADVFLLKADPGDPRIMAALAELKEIIQRHYPVAQFIVTHGDEPEGFYLKPMVDLDDIEEVFDTVIDRLLQMQIDEEFPVYVVPVRSPERVAQLIRERERGRRVGEGHEVEAIRE